MTADERAAVEQAVALLDLRRERGAATVLRDLLAAEPTCVLSGDDLDDISVAAVKLAPDDIDEVDDLDVAEARALLLAVLKKQAA